jgi:hypothetical protein
LCSRSITSEVSAISTTSAGAGVGTDVVPYASVNDNDVRLRLRGVVERERQLGTHVEAGTKRPREDFAQRGDGGPVPAALRLAYDEKAVEQLEALVFAEYALVHQPLVLLTCPATGFQE